MSTEHRTKQPERLGPFTLGSIIGSGGFGTVYRATSDDGNVVALKVLAPHVDSHETLRRFEREGNIRIDHPNVVRVIDAGEDRGVSYIAFELLEGSPLNVVLESAPLPIGQVLDIGLQICSGLGAAHERGIVHRDLKPGNVFCTGEGPIKVLDFGIARPMSQAGAQLTMAGSVIGTPGYLSPEQAKGEAAILPAADLWSLGVILYQACSGTNPFIRSTAVATILAVVLEEAPPLSEKGPLPRGLAEIVHKCLQKDPAQRWKSAEALAEALSGIDVEGSVVTEIPAELGPSIPLDEQRVVALLLASEVHDLPMLDAAVREWGGELIPMLGGAIGVFGGHTYEGDEAVRAVQAALMAREAAGFVAVASGRAAGHGGAVSGDAVRAVERAVEAKLAGVAVDAATARGLAGQFELRPAREGVFEIPSAIARRDTGSFPTLREDLPLLGRHAELAQIDAAIGTAMDDAHAIAVWVTGPPGIGKSRLRAEVERRLRSRSVTTLAARAESHRRDVAFHFMASVLRSEPTLEPFFLNPGVPPARRRKALEEFLVRVLDDRTWARQCLEPLARLLGLPDESERDVTHRHSDPQLMADRVRVSLSDVLGRMGIREPLALVLDDVQWADEASLRLIDELLGRLAERPFLLFVAARSELAERHADLFSGRELVRITPRGLRAKDVATLADAIAEREVPAAVVEEVATRTGGNPFFVEQIVRELVEQDLLDAELESLPIPIDVEGAVQSRLDHLPVDEKQLCKRAAVYSGAFTEHALRALEQPEPGRHLGALAKRGLVSAHGAHAEVGAEREYRFRNSLMAEVAYRMNSEDARRELHRLAAEFLASASSADREELARHWEIARQPREAAQAYAQAALRAARRGDSTSVLRCSEHALALGLDDAFELYLARADALSFLGRRDAQRESIERALAIAADPTQRARALSEKAGMLASLGEHDVGLEVAVQAVAAARATDDVDVLGAALARQGWLLIYVGRISEAGIAISEAASLPGLSPETAALVAAWRAQLFTAMGDLGKRKHAYEDAIARYREIGDLRRAATTECNLADTFNRVGAYDEAEASLREAVSSCQRVGNRVVEGYALANLGYALAGQHRYDEAFATYDEALRLAAQLGRPRLALATRLYAARTALEARAPGEVVGEARAIALEAEEGGLPALRANALAIAALAALRAGDPKGALVDAERAMELRDEIGTMEEDEAEIFLALAEALRADGQRDRAREIVARGAMRLEFLAGRIADASWRARFLVEVPVNRRLIELDGAGD